MYTADTRFLATDETSLLAFTSSDPDPGRRSRYRIEVVGCQPVSAPSPAKCSHPAALVPSQAASCRLPSSYVRGSSRNSLRPARPPGSPSTPTRARPVGDRPLSDVSRGEQCQPDSFPSGCHETRQVCPKTGSHASDARAGLRACVPLLTPRGTQTSGQNHLSFQPLTSSRRVCVPPRHPL